MYTLLTQLLDIPNYHVVSAEIETDTITLDIESTSQTAACPHCDKSSKALHERHPRTVRDLPYQWQTDLSSLCQASILL